MASTHGFESHTLGLITSQTTINKVSISYSEKDQAMLHIDSGGTSYIRKTRDIYLKGTYKSLPRNNREIGTATDELVLAVGIRNGRISLWIP